MKKLLRNKKGITLLETIVGVVIFAILGLMVAQIFTSTANTSVSVEQDSEYTMIVDSVAQTLTKDLEAASDVFIDGQAIASLASGYNGKEININFANGSFDKAYEDTSANGNLLKLAVSGGSGDSRDVMQSDFYKDKGIDVSYDYVRTNTAVTIVLNIDVVDINDPSKVLFQRQVAVRPPALQPQTNLGAGLPTAQLMISYDVGTPSQVFVDLDGSATFLRDLTGQVAGNDFGGWIVESSTNCLGALNLAANQVLSGSYSFPPIETDDPLNADFRLYLKAKLTAHTYTIAYNGNGATGGSTASQTGLKCADPQTLRANGFTRTEYTFIGWARNASSTTKDYSSGQTGVTFSPMPAKNSTITLYAVWSKNPPPPAKKYTIVFDWVDYKNASNKGNITTMTGVEEGVVTPLPSTSGISVTYNITGWEVISPSGGSFIANIATSTFTASGYADNATITVRPIFEKEKYTLTLNLNGSSTYPVTYNSVSYTTAAYTKTFEWGEKLAVPDPTRTGHTFGGWYSNATDKINGNGILTNTTPNKNITAYANWTIKTYDVNFYLNENASGNGTKVGQTYKVEHGKTLAQSLAIPNPTILPSVPDNRDGYACSGWWYTKNAAAGTQFSETKPVTANTDVFACWTAFTYDLTLHTNGGTISTSGYTLAAPGKYIKANALVHGGSFTPPNPTAAGPQFTFDGWYIDDVTFEQKVNFSAITGSIEAYAKWKPTEYTITFYKNDLNGTASQKGTVVATYKVNYGEYIPGAPVPADPGRTYYQFQGWFDTQAASGGNQWTSAVASQPITATKEYFARWTEKQYTVTFYANGATMPTTGTNAFTPDGTDSNGKPKYKKTYSATTAGNTGVIFNASTSFIVASGYPELKKFAAWHNGSYKTNDKLSTTAVTKFYDNMSVWLELVDVQVTVTYNANGGTGTVPVQTKYTVGDPYTAPNGNLLTKTTDPKTFIGWSKKQLTTSATSIGTPTHCDFIPGDSSKGTATVNAAFLGGTWTTKSPATFVTGTDIAVTLYAVWGDKTSIVKDPNGWYWWWWGGYWHYTPDKPKPEEEEIPTITITYYIPQGANDLSGPAYKGTHSDYGTGNTGKYYSVTIPKIIGDQYSFISPATFNNFVQAGTKSKWFSGPASTTEHTQPLTIGIATGDTKAYARWNDNSIRYYNGGTASQNTLKKTQTVSVVDYVKGNLTLLTKTGTGATITGQDFTGWKQTNPNTGTIYTDGQSVACATIFNGASTVDLTAQWNAESFLIVYEVPNGSISSFTQAATPGPSSTYNSAALPTTLPQAVKDQITNKTYSSVTVSGSTYYFGCYTYGSNNLTASTPVNNAGFKIPAVASGRWKKSGTTVSTTASQTGALHLVASWSNYVITYTDNGATKATQTITAPTYPSTQSIKSVSTSDINISKTGHRFNGWMQTTSPNANVARAAGTAITLPGLFGAADVTTATLSAQWQALSYVVVFEIGNEVANFTYNQKLNTSPEFSSTDVIKNGFPNGLNGGGSPVNNSNTVTSSSNAESSNGKTKWYIAWYTYNSSAIALPVNVTTKSSLRKFTGWDDAATKAEEEWTTIPGGTARVLYLIAVIKDAKTIGL